MGIYQTLNTDVKGNTVYIDALGSSSYPFAVVNEATATPQKARRISEDFQHLKSSLDAVTGAIDMLEKALGSVLAPDIGSMMAYVDSTRECELGNSAAFLIYRVEAAEQRLKDLTARVRL